MAGVPPILTAYLSVHVQLEEGAWGGFCACFAMIIPKSPMMGNMAQRLRHGGYSGLQDISDGEPKTSLSREGTTQLFTLITDLEGGLAAFTGSASIVYSRCQCLTCEACEVVISLIWTVLLMSQTPAGGTAALSLSSNFRTISSLL